MHPSVSSDAYTQYYESSRTSAGEGSTARASTSEAPVIGQHTLTKKNGIERQEEGRHESREEAEDGDRGIGGVEEVKEVHREEEDQGGRERREVDTWHDNESDPSWPLV